MRARTLRSHLTILVLVSVVPLLIFAVIMAALLEKQQRASLERSFRDTTRALAVAVDRELTWSIRALEALGASQYLDTGDLEPFYREAQRVVATHPGWLTINLTDPSGRQLINLSRPFGAPLPSTGNLEDVRQTLDTGQPAISNLFVGLVLKTPTVGVTVPVKRNGRLKYVLGTRLDVAGLSRLLSEGQLPPDWVAGIIDRKGIIIARTRGIETLLGAPAPPEFVARSRQSDESWALGVTMDGIAVYVAHSRSSLSGWTVGLGVPVAIVEAPGRTSRWAIIGGGCVFLLLAGVLASVFGGRIAGGIASLSASARALGRGDVPSLTGSSKISEIADVERELVEAATALRDSEASFRLLFADNPLPMWVYDVATMYFLEVNAAAIQHYGYSREEFLRMRITDIRPPEDLPRLKDVVAGLAAATDQATRRHAGTWRHRLKDGRIRDVDIVSHSIEFAGRRATLVVAIDVTELKQAQASLARSTERLQILHEIDRALIAAEAPVVIAETVLPRLRDLLGVPRAIVNLFDLAAGEAEWLAAAGRHRVRLGPGVRFPLALMGDVEALRRGELQVVDTAALPRSPEAEALLASGVHTYMVVPMIAGGELIGAVSFGGERSEFPPEQVSIAREAATQLAIALEQARLRERVKRHTEELEQRVAERTLELSVANERLEREIVERRRAEADAARANQAKSEFLSRMSHELRTPLNAILGFAQLLELDAQRPEDRESAEQIIKGGRHLLSLINEVLDIARIEAGGLSLSLEPVRVGDAVQQVLDLARPLAAARAIDLQSTGAALHGRHVWADSQRLQQVLLNLVSNGIKYNRERGTLTIACDAADERRLRIRVRDTGPGIAPALRERLFQPFDRLGAEQGGVEGTGLGLVLSKRLVEAMGGTLGVESVQDEGSTFWVELLETESPPERHERGEPDATAPAVFSKSGTVLYIEDNLSNLRLVERAIARHRGLKLIPAMQGRLGLELARQHRPDLVLLDLHLPDIPGEQVLRELHADPQLRRTPVIVLSADATPGQVERLVAIGARAYLTKPLDVRRFLALVDEALPSREATDG